MDEINHQEAATSIKMKRYAELMRNHKKRGIKSPRDNKLETEGNFIQMIKTVESIGRCVILVDEIEKYLNSGATSGQGDSGTSSRSFGTLLSWLSDRTSPAFIIFTSNNHLALPMELIRPGRFDQLFWIDLPTHDELLCVYDVVIRKYGRKVTDFDIPVLADASAGFTGAEIDNLFKDAMFKSFDSREEVGMKDVLHEIQALVPQSKINEEAITTMRNKVNGRMRPAANYLSLKDTTTKIVEGRKMKVGVD